MRSYEKILNPKTKRFVSVFSKTGQSILKNYVNQINSNSQTGGRVSLPSEFFGGNSGRYLEVASGTRNTAGGNTTGNGFEPYSTNTVQTGGGCMWIPTCESCGCGCEGDCAGLENECFGKCSCTCHDKYGGAVPGWVSDWIGHGHHKHTLKYITKYVMEKMQNELDEEKIFEEIVQGYYTFVQDGPSLEIVVRQTIWYMKKYYWILRQDRLENLNEKKEKKKGKKERKKWSKQEQTNFNKARLNMEKKDKEGHNVIGGAFGASGPSGGIFSNTGDSNKDGQKDANKGKKDKERYDNDSDYAKSHDKSVAKELAKED